MYDNNYLFNLEGKMIKNKKGFTLLEIVVSLALVLLLGGLTVISLSAISQAKMTKFAQTIKTEFELTRDFAKTHGGEAVFTIELLDDGLKVTRTMTRTGTNVFDTADVQSETSELIDPNLELFYQITGDEQVYHFGNNDHHSVVATDTTIIMEFSQTAGEIIGPHMLDYITISNGSKNYQLCIKQSTGAMYYDYELDQSEYEGNLTRTEPTEPYAVPMPMFVIKDTLDTMVSFTYTGKAIQPNISYDSTRIKIAGEYRAIDKGTYTITFALKDPYSTTWSDGTILPKTLIWKIT